MNTTQWPAGSVVVDGVEVALVEVESVDVEGLPSPEPGTLLLVARVVAEALPQRHDLFFPVDLLRNDHGGVIGCQALGRVRTAS